jgi:hypothetical protein
MKLFKIDGIVNSSDAMSKVLYRILHKRYFNPRHGLQWFASRNSFGMAQKSHDPPRFIVSFILVSSFFFAFVFFPRLLFWISYFMLFYLPSFHNAVINSMYNGPPSFPLIICTTPQRRSSTLMWRLYRCLNTDHCFHRTALPLRIAGSLVYYIGALLCCSSFIPHFLFSASLLIPL